MSSGRWRLCVWAVLVLGGSGGCAGASAAGAGGPLGSGQDPAHEPDLYAGDPAGPPRMEGLPECDVPRSTLSAEMRRAWLLVEEALAVPTPSEPPGNGSGELSQWSDTTLKAWMDSKSDVVMAAREALNRAAEQSMRERIMAGALLGLVYEDVTDVLVALPMPEELKSEPDVENIYREVLISNARPYVANAEAAYEACAANAEQSKELPHWGRYCARRLETLPGVTNDEPPPPPPPGTTEVIVERE